MGTGNGNGNGNGKWQREMATGYGNQGGVKLGIRGVTTGKQVIH